MIILKKIESIIDWLHDTENTNTIIGILVIICVAGFVFSTIYYR